MRKYYYYAPSNGIEDLIKILEQKAIFCKRKLCTEGSSDKTDVDNYSGYSRLDFISVYEKLPDNFYNYIYIYCGYYNYIDKNICIVLNENINTVKIKFINSKQNENLIDEYQVRDLIPLEYFAAIGYPFEFEIKILDYYLFQNDKEHYANYTKEIEQELAKINDLLLSNNINIPIVDSSSYKLLFSLKRIKLK